MLLIAHLEKGSLLRLAAVKKSAVVLDKMKKRELPAVDR